MNDKLKQGTELETLKTRCNELRTRIHELDDQRRYTENKPYVGKFFRFRNSYSCPQTDADYWYVYYRVDSISAPRGQLCGVRFQTDTDGKAEIVHSTPLSLSLLFDEIDADAFYTALEDVQKIVMAIHRPLQIQPMLYGGQHGSRYGPQSPRNPPLEPPKKSKGE